MSEYPALDVWQREIRAGRRNRNTFDSLWEAACAEANAREFEDVPELHRKFMEDARRIVTRTLSQRQQ
jgi:hypothetical protein